MPDLFDAHGSTLLFIPLAHVFGRVIEIGCIESGTVLGHSADVKNIVSHLGEFQPTFLLSVPRVFEKVFNSAQMKATGEGKGRIFDMAAGTAIDYSKAMDTGGGNPLKIKHFIFDKLVYGKLRAALGGKVEYAVSGGAARCSSRALLPGHRGDHPGGLRTDRDVSGDHHQPSGRDPHRHRRSAHARSRSQDRRRR